jgi:uncharacterized membrane protein HdeD (DUF308 family)
MSDVEPRTDRRRVTTAVGGWIVLCGLVLLLWPGATIRVVVVLVGLGAVGFGVSELSRVFAGGETTLQVSSGLIGLANVIGGVLVLLSPFVSLDAARTVVGIYWLIAGLVEVVGALVKPEGRIERFSVGVLSLAAGAVAVLLPAISVLVFVWLAGAWLVVVGLVVLVLDRLASPGSSAAT